MMDFYNQKHAKARKSHKCEFCGKEIIPGETYSYESGKFDGGENRIDMQELEKIMEEIEEATRQEDTPIYREDIEVDGYVRQSVVEDIIRKHMNDGWISVEDRLPEEKLNKVSCLVTVNFGFGADVRILIFTDGHWWCGPKILDKYVIAWRPFPEPYRPERSDNHDGE